MLNKGAIEELRAFLRKVKYVENIDGQIERLCAAKERIEKRKTENNGSLEDDWEFLVPVAIAGEVADMILLYYQQLKKETEEELECLEITHIQKGK